MIFLFRKSTCVYNLIFLIFTFIWALPEELHLGVQTWVFLMYPYSYFDISQSIADAHVQLRRGVGFNLNIQRSAMHARSDTPYFDCSIK